MTPKDLLSLFRNLEVQSSFTTNPVVVEIQSDGFKAKARIAEYVEGKVKVFNVWVEEEILTDALKIEEYKDKTLSY